MKGAPAICLIWFFIAGMANACPNTITETSVGGVQLGMSKAEIMESGLPIEEEIVEYLAIEYLEYRITICEHADVVVSFDENDRVSHIKTTSAYFKTAEGAQVGMTLGQLQELYPQGTISRGLGDYGLYFVYKTGRGNLGMAFDLDELDYDCIVNDVGCKFPLVELRSIRFAI